MPKFLNNVDIEAPTLTITNGAGGGEYQPIVTVESTNSTTGNEPLIRFYKNSTGSSGEDMGTIEFLGKDNGGTDAVYGSIACQATSAAVEGYDGTIANSERGQMLLSVASGGSTYPVIKGTAASTGTVVDVTIGTNAASTTTIAGDLALIGNDMASLGALTLTTGGAYEIATSSSGNITLDSAGDIALEAATTSVSADLSVGDKINECKRKFSPTGSNTAGTNSGGDIVYIGTGDTVLGEIVHYKSDGTWEAADATDVTKCDGLLGVALGTDPAVNGVLLRGMVTIADIDGTEAVGMPLFLSEDATGHANMAAPSNNNEVVRIIGYCLHATNGEIWFNPDNTFVEVTA